MKQPEHVILIPGLGDNHSYGQKNLVPLIWRLHGLKVEYDPIIWTGNDYARKLEIIGNRIEELAASGRVSVVGISAGASAALNLYARHPKSVYKLITICGKINGLAKIQQHYYAKSPNFKLSIDLLPQSLNSIGSDMRQRILCIRPLSDNIVPVEDAVLDGAQKLTIKSKGHAKSITYALTIGSKKIAGFIKQDR